ncbi:MAG: YbhB/YbcL family Raf kinase inhibitor-like protein [Pseudomonadota bacterium]
MVKRFCLFVLACLFFVSPVVADEFSISFEWGNIPLCTSGNPNTVSNPRFVLSNVPEGTRFICFSLTDLDRPNYNHGGGTIAYTGNNTIEPGAFKYQSPCPPDGAHLYEWSAKAKETDGFFSGSIGSASAKKKYPEKN